MREIYVILTQPDSVVARFLKIFTRDEYNHSSICLDKNFTEFYSFGRLKLSNPFIGGFIKENAFTHVFGMSDKVPCMVIKKVITEEQYNKLRAIVDAFSQHSNLYGYDYINCALAKTYFHVPHSGRYFCSEFVAHLLAEIGISLPKIPEKIKPNDFTELNDSEIIYKGELKEFCANIKKTVC